MLKLGQIYVSLARMLPTQGADNGIALTRDQPKQSSSSDTIQPQQAQWQPFSHVEIRKMQPPTAVSVPGEPNGKNARLKQETPTAALIITDHGD